MADENKMTLDKFEEAYEDVKKVTLDTKLIYSDYWSSVTGGKVYLKPENRCVQGKRCLLQDHNSYR